jgi:hypothetical protein
MSNYKLSATGKLFFASLVAYLGGAKSIVKLKGTPEQIKAISAAVMASKEFQDEIKREGATIESVIEKMRLKNLTAAEFKKITGGKPWPLVVILIPTLYDMLHGASLILG